MAELRESLISMIDDALGADPRAALIAAKRLPGEVDWLTRRAVARARAEGFDWGRIGRLLGMSRQGARQKFALSPPLASPHTLRMRRYRRPFEEGERAVERFKSSKRDAQPQPLPRPDDPYFW